jgi:hypothetical protein
MPTDIIAVPYYSKILWHFNLTSGVSLISELSPIHGGVQGMHFSSILYSYWLYQM